MYIHGDTGIGTFMTKKLVALLMVSNVYLVKCTSDNISNEAVKDLCSNLTESKERRDTKFVVRFVEKILNPSCTGLEVCCVLFATNKVGRILKVY